MRLTGWGLAFTILFLNACASRSGVDGPTDELAQELQKHDSGTPGADSTLPRFQFDWPLSSPVVINYFGWRKKRMHEGIDLRASTGTPIFAAADGKIVYAARRLRGYGRMVAILHEDDWSTIYAHLSKIKSKVGQEVKKGALIGFSGNTGRSRGPHLHFEIRKGSDPLDPLIFLPKP